MSPRPIKRLRRIIGHPATLVVGVLLLSISALSGNVGQFFGRADLKDQLSDANAKIDEQQHQLDSIKGEQECRSQIASTAEVYAGQLQVAVGRFVVAANARDAAGVVAAVADISRSSELLGPALSERVKAVETCAGRSTPPTTTTTITTEPTTSSSAATSTTARRAPRRRLGTVPTTRTTAPVPTSRTTTTTSPPSTTCVDLFGVLCL